MIYEFMCIRCDAIREYITNDYDLSSISCECGGMMRKILSTGYLKFAYELTEEDIYRPMTPTTRE